MVFVHFVKVALLALLTRISKGKGTIYEEASLTTATIFLQHDHEGPAESVSLKNANNGNTVGDVTARIVNDILLVEIKGMEGGTTTDICLMTKEVHGSPVGAGEDSYDFVLDSERTSRLSFFFGTDMKQVRAYCDNNKELTMANEGEWNDSYNIIGQVFFQCHTVADDGVGNDAYVGQEQTDGLNSVFPASSLRGRYLGRNVNVGEAVSHFEIILGCDIQDVDRFGENGNQINTESLEAEDQNFEVEGYTTSDSDQSSVCPEVDLTPCHGRTEVCVADLLWDQRPLPYVPTEGDEDAKEITFNGRNILKYKVGYVATNRAIGKPFAEDRHRALILTQPKVGTGAMWEAMSHVSDFVLRSHEVGILHPNSLWIPFPGCTAKPADGDCTVVLAFRDPKTWLDSAYFQFRSNRPQGETLPDSDEEVRAYHEFFRDPAYRSHILDWWRIAEQLRLLGIPPASVKPFMKSVMDSGGVKILGPGDLTNVPRWINDCNVIVLQMEMAKYATLAERAIRSILPDFRFQKPTEKIGRTELNPELAVAYSAVKEAALPSDILEAMFQESPDFGEAWELYHNLS